MSETAVQLSRGRTPGIQLKHNVERNEFIVSMSLAGFTAYTIRKNVNKIGPPKGWGGLASERSINRIVSEHFQGKPMSAAEAKAYDYGRREAALAQQQKLIEDLTIHLRERKKAGHLAPYEFQYSMRVLANIVQKGIENNGWNASKKNCGSFHQGESQVDIYDRCREEMLSPECEEARNELIEFIDSFTDDSRN